LFVTQADVRRKILNATRSVQDQRLTLQIWDTAGQERFVMPSVGLSSLTPTQIQVDGPHVLPRSQRCTCCL
jgi:GTPase SAR1 family protein